VIWSLGTQIRLVGGHDVVKYPVGINSLEGTLGAALNSSGTFNLASQFRAVAGLFPTRNAW